MTKGLMISMDGTREVEIEDVKALVDAGYVVETSPDVFEVTDAGREYVRRMETS